MDVHSSEEEDHFLDDEEEGDDMGDEGEDVEEGERQIFLPGVHELQEGEVLEFDRSAYHVMEPMTVEWPCLSFDIISDNLGQYRTKYPQTLYLTAGTQAFDNDNKLMFFKISNLHKLEQDDDSSEGSDDEQDKQPKIDSQYIKHEGAVNRVRKMPQKQNIVATWSDLGWVHIFDGSNHISKLENVKQKFNLNVGPLQSFNGHQTEGFSMDWNPKMEGRFLSGDCKNKIFLWEFSESKWMIDSNPFAEHTASVEDLQWSPTEVNGFASCSVDKTVKIWDCRNKAKSMANIQAHKSDVNVISWHKNIPYLILSGCDDGEFKVWDIRSMKDNNAYATFNFHKQAITSVEWSTFDENLFAVSSADNSVTLWDMSLYEDEEDQKLNQSEKQNIPHQLMFLHMGQQDIKEVHFHPQIPGLVVSTAGDGFNFWRPMNIEVERDEN